MNEQLPNQNVENPYAAPVAAGGSPGYPQRPSGTWVRQVRILAILMAVQGFLEFLFGLYFVGLGFFFPRFMAMQQAQQNQVPAEQAEQISSILFLVFLIAGCGITLLGILRIVAGILGFNFRGRGLGIASHFLGLLTVFSFYCVVTALPLCIYGCLVYFNREVSLAFRMRKEGQTPNQILTHFH